MALTRGTRRWVVLSLMLLAAGWALAPDRVPLYDGIGFPDEPYRFVQRPAGDAAITSPATGARGSGVMSHGANPNALQVASDEQGPQVSVFVDVGAAHAPVRGRRLDVRAQPRAPDKAPAGTHFDGNVYQVTMTTDAGSVTLEASHVAAIQLRATTAQQPGPTMQYRRNPTAPWRPLETRRAGNDIYQSLMPGPGDYGLTFPSGSAANPAPAAARSGLRAHLLLVVLIVTILAMAGVILAIRFAARRRKAP